MKIENILSQLQIEKSETRCWGKFYCIDKSYNQRFINLFFQDTVINDVSKIYCKILCVSQNKKLSLQYHKKRKEIWKILDGQVNAIVDKDEISLNTNDVVVIESYINHRLIGQENDSIIAEIWINDNEKDPTSEDDIVRLEDDFGRV